MPQVAREPASTHHHYRRLRLAAVLGLVIVAAGLSVPPAAGLPADKAITQYIHNRWTPRDRLPAIPIRAIAQTTDGYLWLATPQGLLRFDGVRFVNVAPDQNATVLLADRAGTLWSGSRQGLRDHRTPGSKRPIRALQAARGRNLQCLLEARDGTLWIGTTTGLIHLTAEGRTLLTRRQGLATDHVTALAEDSGGTLWIGTLQGLYALRDGALTLYTEADGLSDRQVRSLWSDADGSLWVGTQHGGVNRRDPGGTISPIIAGPPPHAAPSLACPGLAPRGSELPPPISSLLRDRDGQLWIGTEGGGLCRLQEGPEASGLSTTLGLTGDTVMALFEDREGSLWVATDSGLDRFKDGRYTAFTTREGLTHNAVRSLYLDHDGQLWVNTDGGGLNLLHNGMLSQPRVNERLAADGATIQAIYQDAAGDLWFGTDRGLYRYRKGSWAVFNSKQGLPDGIITTVRPDSDGGLWIATAASGISHWTPQGIDIFNTGNGLSNDTVRSLYRDPDGSVWAGTDGGLNHIQNGSIHRYSVADGLASRFVLSLYGEPDGTLWIGTEGGLNRLKDGRMITVTSRDGLFSDVIYQLLEDDRGNFWACSLKGIFVLRKQQLTDFAEGRTRAVYSYPLPDQGNLECYGPNERSGLKTADGKLWFASTEGLIMIDPQRLLPNTVPPTVVIEEVTANDQPVDPQRPVRLPAATRLLDFRFTAPILLYPQQVRFQYQLEGFDRQWRSTTQRFAHYTNLPPGPYRFRVEADNGDLLSSDEPAEFAFELATPLYRQQPVYGLGLLMVLVLARGIYQLRLQHLMEYNRVLRERVARRTQEVLAQQRELSLTNQQLTQTNSKLELANEQLQILNRQKADFLAIAAHDLRTPLVNLKGFAGEIAAMLERLQTLTTEALAWLREDFRQRAREAFFQDAPEALGFINASSDRMDQLINGILVLSRLGRRPLQFERLNMTALTHEVLKNLSYQIARKRVHVTVGDLPEVLADRSAMEQVLENLLRNAVSYLDPARPGEVEISAQVEDGAKETLFHVRDNGCGIADNQKEKVFKAFGRAGRPDVPGEGIGLAFVRTLIERHGGRIGFESQLGAGTTFTFSLPHVPARAS